MLQGDLKNARRRWHRRARSSPEVRAAVARAVVRRVLGRASTRTRSTRSSSSRTGSRPRLADADLLFLRYVGTDLDSVPEVLRPDEDRRRRSGAARASAASCSRSTSTRSSSSSRRRAGSTRSRRRCDAGARRSPRTRRCSGCVRENRPQVREILLQLDALKTDDMRAQAAADAGLVEETDVGKLLAAFFQTDDQNFQRALRLLLPGAGAVAGAVPRAHRRRADHQGLHPLRLRAVGQPAGLRHLPVPGAGEVDAGRRAQPDGHGVVPRALRLHERARSWRRSRRCRRRPAPATSTARTPRPSCSAAGPAARLVAEATPGLIDDERSGFAGASARRSRQRGPGRAASSTRTRSTSGVVLNAAVILKDPKKIQETMAAIAARSRTASSLGAQGDRLAEGGRPHRPVHQRRPDGALRRDPHHLRGRAGHHQQRAGDGHAGARREIGTLRAIGAQRRFILAMLVIESMSLGLVFGGAGALLGSARWSRSSVGKIGIPANADVCSSSSRGRACYPFLSAGPTSSRRSSSSCWSARSPASTRPCSPCGSRRARRCRRTSRQPMVQLSPHRLPQPGAAPPAHAVPRRRHRRRDRAAGAPARALSTASARP